jgi:anti-anti-sigma factor
MNIPTQDRMSLTITRPTDSSVDCVEILGDVDMSDSVELGHAADHLHASDPSSICVDLGGNTFMDSTLLEFLEGLGDSAGGARPPLVLCRPRPMAQRLIHLTGLDAHASVRPDLPRRWPRTPTAPAASTSAWLHATTGAVLVTVLTTILAILMASSAQAATAPGLGSANSFVVLAGAGVTNTGPTTLNGDLGTFPTTSVTGASTITQTGTNHAGDAVTQSAKNDLVTAYNSAAAQGPPSTISTDLGGQTLVAGVYNAATSIGLTGALTLDAKGDPNAVFIFQAGSTLTTGSGSSVVLRNGAQACNIFWQVGSSATLGTGSAFRGSILALTDITVTTAATIEGRVLARNGAVTLDTNTITRPACTTTRTASGTSTASPTSTRSAGSGGNTGAGGSDLAHTGVNTPLGGFGLALLVTGGGLLMAARLRRPTRKHRH